MLSSTWFSHLTPKANNVIRTYTEGPLGWAGDEMGQDTVYV